MKTRRASSLSRAAGRHADGNAVLPYPRRRTRAMTSRKSRRTTRCRSRARCGRSRSSTCSITGTARSLRHHGGGDGRALEPRRRSRGRSRELLVADLGDVPRTAGPTTSPAIRCTSITRLRRRSRPGHQGVPGAVEPQQPERHDRRGRRLRPATEARLKASAGDWVRGRAGCTTQHVTMADAVSVTDPIMPPQTARTTRS